MKYRSILSIVAVVLFGCELETVNDPLPNMDAEPGSSAGGEGGLACDAGAKRCLGCVESSDCSAASPVCIDGVCAACQESAQCPPSAPVCSASHACTGCTGKADCAERDATPVCDVAGGACVACTAGDGAACAAGGQVCLTGGTECVACNADTDCALAGKARCDTVRHECVACETSEQCAHVTAGSDSDLDVCNAGTCVACTPATETTECGATACDPDTLTCTGKNRDSVVACGTCRSDSECALHHKCIQVPFMGADSGYHCMLQASAPGGCPQPYQFSNFITVSSKSGAAPTPYCTHQNTVTTCEAILALTSGTACTAGTVQADCGQGALCGAEVGGTANKCTYACDGAAVCPGSSPCNQQSAGAHYCGGPP